MIDAEKPVFLQISDESQDRVLHAGKVIGVENNTYTCELSRKEEMMPIRSGKPRLPRRKVPFGTRPGARVNPERYPVMPKVPGTRDTGYPSWKAPAKPKRRPPRIK